MNLPCQQAHRAARISSTGLAAIAVVFALLAFCVPAGATTIERVTSPGGIEFWLVRDGTVPLVSVNYSFRGGAVQDPDDKAGLSDITVATLDEGAGFLNGTEFQARMERKAIELTFRSSREYIRGTVRTLVENVDETFELLRLALNEPRFDPSAVERMRDQMVSLLQSQSTNPNSIASLRWWATAFPGHPYGRPAAGTLESIARITSDDMRDYMRRVIARDTLKIAVVGDIDAATAGRLIDLAFGSLPAKGALFPVSTARMQGLGVRTVVNLDVPQAVVTFGGPGVARNDPDFMAAYLLNHILAGGSSSSRLYSEVREKRGLAYGVSAGLTWLEHSSVLVGATATRANATAETIDVIEQEYRRMASDGPTADELAKAKAYLKGAFALNLDTSTNIAAMLVQMQVDNLGIDYIDRRSAMIDSVTLADIRRVARRLLGGGLLVTVVGRPQGVTSRGSGG